MAQTLERQQAETGADDNLHGFDVVRARRGNDD